MLAHIQDIVEAVSNSFGDNYFTKVSLALHKAIAADYIFIARINKHKQISETEVLIAKGEVADNFSYELTDTPCAEVADNSICYHPKNVCSLYPDDKLLADMSIQAYIGTPLVDSKHNVIGILVALFESEQNNTEESSALFQVFSGRIAAELERLSYEQSLADKIAERTIELSNTVKKLKVTQNQLIESEKMSALGNLVAGVSHEVNTPLGLAITTNSLMSDEYRKLQRKIDSQSLTMKDMDNFRKTLGNALDMQGENLTRAKHLIENFKKTAADQHQLEIEVIDIEKYYHKVVSTLKSILKSQQVDLSIHCNEAVILSTYPGIHAQIITNLVNNSVRHGFSNNTDLDIENEQLPSNKKITIKIEASDTIAGQINVIYTDNGRGLSNEAKKHIFEPFFTTARKHGGVGLGMSIVYNLINQRLNGFLKFEEVEVGTCFHYSFTESIFKLPTDN